MAKAKQDPRIDKRVVTVTHRQGGLETVVTDYVRPDFLDAYVAAAEATGATVEVGGVDAGPGGYHGATHVPENLDHPLAGQTFHATNPEDD